MFKSLNLNGHFNRLSPPALQMCGCTLDVRCVRKGFANMGPKLSGNNFKSLLRTLKYPIWTSSYIVDEACLGAVAQRGWRGGRLVGGEGDTSLLFQRVLLHLQRVDGSSPLTEASCDFGLFKIYNMRMWNHIRYLQRSHLHLLYC